MTDQATLSLSRTVPSARDRRLATIIMAVSFAAFVAVVPFATVHLPHIPAFIAAYSAALFICDLLTAALIASQMAQLRSPALLILTAGYCFDALIIIPHALSFPRLFAPSGVLRGGAQTTAWLYIFWHAVFPLFIIAYAWFDARGADEVDRHARVRCRIRRRDTPSRMTGVSCARDAAWRDRNSG